MLEAQWGLTKINAEQGWEFEKGNSGITVAVIDTGVDYDHEDLTENNISYIFITIIICVLVYFFNDFSAALGETEKLSVEIAVWMPIVIIFIFSAVGIIYANQK